MKKPLLIFALALALLASDALAQCSGKTVHIKLPAEWRNNTYIWWEGSFIKITGTRNDGWTTFTIPSVTYDNPTKTVIFSDYNDLYNSTDFIHAITKTAFVSDNALPITNGFTCSDFGPDGTWIMENPTTGAIFISTTPPDAYYFYFLPPDDDDWILGTHYLVYGPNKTKIRLEMDTDRCGWYKTMWFNVPLPDGNAWIYLDNGENYNKLGIHGFDEDPLDWQNGDPTPFNLSEQFGNEHDLFFTPSSAPIWRKTDPATLKGRCSYDFAAYIYQRTVYSNTDGFSWYCDPQWYECTGSGATPRDTKSFGICKGLVQPTLDANGKMQWANRTNCANPVTGGEPLSGWGNETNFENAFQEVPGKSKKYCYNMPFTRRPSGLWEFDANYLCKDGVTTDYNSTYNSGCGASQGGVGNVGGFYNMKASDGTVLGVPTTGMQQGSNSTSYPTGQYTGNRVGVLPDYQWCFDRGQSGKGTNCTGLYPTGPGPNQTLSEMAVAHCPDFGKEDDPNATAAEKAACPYNGDSRPKGVRGGHLCFESQEAEFIYNPGQEFFFRGDDDIWVFINNQLVIDIGGNHMPAPGYVKLDTISVPEKLVAGKKYPIKIFFCDRRGPGSNVRIATNMYFSQKSGLFLKEGAAQSLGDVCLETSGGGSCGSESSGPTQQCGPELKDKLNYYIARRDGSNKLNLNANTPECSASGNTLTCFKSITIDFNNGKVQVLPVSQGLVGTWVVYAEVLGIEPKPAPLKLGTVIGKNTIDNNDPSSSSGGGQPLSPSSSSNEVSPIAQISQTMIQAQEPLYYNLKGEPLGTKKPSKAGVYIAYQKGKSKVIAVK